MADSDNILQAVKWIAKLIHNYDPKTESKEEYTGPVDGGGFPQSQYKEQIKQGKVIFPAPSGFLPPSGVGKGTKFRVTAEVYLTDEGKVCLESLDGKTIDSDSETKEIKGDNVIMETMKYRLPPTGLPSD